MSHHRSILEKLRLAGLEDAIQETYNEERNIFFLPFGMYTNREIGLYMQNARLVVQQTWNKIATHLKQPLETIQISSLYQLPDGLPFFFDPNHNATKKAFELYKTTGKDMITAPELVTNVIQIITQLHTLGVNRNATAHILKHCVAFVFSASRAHRKEGKDLMLPSFFTALYGDTVRLLTDGRMQYCQLPAVPQTLIEKHLSAEIDQMSSFQTFGMLRYPVASMRCVVSMRDLGKEVLQKVELISKEWKQRKSVNEGSNLATILRNTVQCGRGQFYYKVKSAPNARENCCVSICNAAELIHRIGMSSKRECCAGCNAARCSVGGTSRFAKVSTIKVEPYGYAAGGTIPICI
ncbi:unnamed protein product [Agarophyton chilense]